MFELSESGKRKRSEAIFYGYYQTSYLQIMCLGKVFTWQFLYSYRHQSIQSDTCRFNIYGGMAIFQI